MSEISKSALAASITKNEEVSSLLQKLNPFQNSGSIQIPNVTDARIAAELVDNFTDSQAVSADLLAIGDNLIQQNVTARDFIIEPKFVDQLTSIHAPYKSTTNPATVAFNESGECASGITGVTLAMPSTECFGWAIQVKAGSTMQGLAQVTLNSGAGFSFVGELDDINEAGWFVVLNHTRDFTRAVTNTLALASGKVDFAYSDTTVNQQFTLSDVYNATTWELKGVNATITSYPITTTREMLALFQGLYYADALPQAAGAILAGYQG